MSTIANLLIKIGVDTNDATRDMTALGGKTGKTLRRSLVPAIAVLGGIGLAAKAGFSEFVGAEKVTAQTGAALKSTGNAANTSVAQIQHLSGALMKKSGVDDEVIQSGANMLLTFTNVRNEVGKGNNIFGQATTAALDMSTALGTDMKSASMMVGKALNDPVKGMTKLQRSGVMFTEGQKKQVAAMVKAGNTMGAQKIILAELNKEFGGSAAAAGKTFSGQMNIAKETLLNLAGSIVAGVMPTLMTFAGVLGTVADWMTKNQTATKYIIGAIAALATVVIAANIALKLHGAAIAVVTAAKLVAVGATHAFTAAQWLLNAALTANPIGLVVVAIALLVAAFVIAWKNSQKFRDIVNGVWAVVKAGVSSFVGFFTTTLPNAFNRVLAWVRGNWKTIAVLISGPFAPLVALAANAFGIRDKFIAALGAVKSAASTAVGAVVGFFTALPGRVASGLSQLPGKVVQVIQGVATAVPAHAAQVGIQMVRGIISGFGSLAGELKSWIESKIRSIVSTLNPFSKVEHGGALHIGQPLAKGAIQGWIAGAAELPSKMTASVRQAVTQARAAVTAEKGRFESAFGGLASVAGRAFSALQSKTLTPSEKALADLQGAHDTARQEADIRSAQIALDQANQAGDAQAALMAQGQLDDALYAAKVADLTKRAEAERTNADEIAAQRQASFDGALAALQAHLAGTQTTAADAMSQMTALLGSYGLDFQTVGGSLGGAFVRGLQDALGLASTSAGNITTKVRAGASKVKKVGGKKVPKLAAGGTATMRGMALVGENGPEFLNLPRGASVVPLDKARASVHIDTMVVQDATDIDRIASRLGRQLMMAV